MRKYKVNSIEELERVLSQGDSSMTGAIELFSYKELMKLPPVKPLMHELRASECSAKWQLKMAEKCASQHRDDIEFLAHQGSLYAALGKRAEMERVFDLIANMPIRNLEKDMIIYNSEAKSEGSLAQEAMLRRFLRYAPNGERCLEILITVQITLSLIEEAKDNFNLLRDSTICLCEFSGLYALLMYRAGEIEEAKVAFELFEYVHRNASDEISSDYRYDLTELNRMFGSELS